MFMDQIHCTRKDSQQWHIANVAWHAEALLDSVFHNIGTLRCMILDTQYESRKWWLLTFNIFHYSKLKIVFLNLIKEETMMLKVKKNIECWTEEWVKLEVIFHKWFHLKLKNKKHVPRFFCPKPRLEELILWTPKHLSKLSLILQTYFWCWQTEQNMLLFSNILLRVNQTWLNSFI